MENQDAVERRAAAAFVDQTVPQADYLGIRCRHRSQMERQTITASVNRLDELT
jgi:hypothetical protein